MSLCKASGLAIFAAVCLLGVTTSSAHAQCNSFATICATEWSGDSVIDLAVVPGYANSAARGINDAGQAVGDIGFIGGAGRATEWSPGGGVTLLGNLPGATQSFAYGINDAGQVVGESLVGGTAYATSGAATASSS
jgi:uncharacterized membrane protein